MALSTPGAVTNSNTRAKRIPKLYWDLVQRLILVVGGIEKFDMNLRRTSLQATSAETVCWRLILAYFWLSCFSTAETTSVESGVTADSKRCTTLPLRLTRNFVKFHLMSPAIDGPVCLVRYW